MNYGNSDKSLPTHGKINWLKDPLYSATWFKRSILIELKEFLLIVMLLN